VAGSGGVAVAVDPSAGGLFGSGVPAGADAEVCANAGTAPATVTSNRAANNFMTFSRLFAISADGIRLSLHAKVASIRSNDLNTRLQGLLEFSANFCWIAQRSFSSPPGDNGHTISVKVVRHGLSDADHSAGEPCHVSPPTRSGGNRPPRKQGNGMTNDVSEWDMDGLDAVMQFLLVPIALASIILLFALTVGLTPASAKPKSPKFHFALKEVEVGCIKGHGAFTSGAGSDGYGCAGTGGTLSCTAKGSCAFRPKLRGLNIPQDRVIENLVRS
jgi:hypothetical protein